MNISIFGLGYVGAVTAGCLARQGHAIVGVDVHPQKVAVWALFEATGGKQQRQLLQDRFEMFRENGCAAAIEEWRQRLVGRMFSLSHFMKALKQRFSH